MGIVLTVYGIETRKQKPKGFVQLYVATAPTVYGIETELISRMFQHHVQ